MRIKTVFGGFHVRDAGIATGKDAITGPQEALPLLKRYANKDREHFIAIYLDTRGRPIALEVVSIGTLSAALVHPREVFKGAILHNASSIIIAHNHPSGDATPSPEDNETTTRMTSAGRLLGIPVHDHIIVARAAHYSYRTAGRIA